MVTATSRGCCAASRWIDSHMEYTCNDHTDVCRSLGVCACIVLVSGSTTQEQIVVEAVERVSFIYLL